MNDQKIVEMLFARSETAISYLQSKFEKYCHTIAYNVLGNDFDANECVNDTYLRVWTRKPSGSVAGSVTPVVSSGVSVCWLPQLTKVKIATNNNKYEIIFLILFPPL